MAPWFDLLPAAVAAVVVVLLLVGLNHWLSRRAAGKTERRFSHQLVMLGVSLVGLGAVILATPFPESLKGQLLALLGLLLSLAVTLSSTTFIGNALAGLMLRSQRAFRAGDFIAVEGHFGRVTERALFHTQIQTERRDLTNLPNLYLATHPVTVTLSTGTIVAAEVSLGYDVARTSVKAALLDAATGAGLDEPFVQILELGDFSVTYRAAGLLRDPKHLLSARSRLRAEMIDALHRAGIEIVSPTFMNTRAFDPDRHFAPAAEDDPGGQQAPAGPTFEELAFDKADEAESVENLHRIDAGLEEKIEALRVEARKLSGTEKEAHVERIDRLEQRREKIAALLRAREESGD